MHAAAELLRFLPHLPWASGAALPRFRAEDGSAPARATARGGPILVLGTARSGTTWLAKIFDSHPQTIYRHEPDAVLRDDGLPWLCPEDEDPVLDAEAARYLRRMARSATLKTRGPEPDFRKSYRGPAARALRRGLSFGLRGLSALGVAPRALGRFPLPDFGAGAARTVVKTVSAHGRAGPLGRAVGAAGGCALFILRDPRAQVASVLRGVAAGRFLADFEFDWMAATRQGRRHGLTADGLAAMPAIEQFAWHWTICNEQILDGLGHAPHVRIVRYDALRADPVGEARALFAFTGLDWHPRSEAFVLRSTAHAGPAGYYQVFRDASGADNTWKSDLGPADRARIEAILAGSALARYLTDLPD
ncbi:MAG: sulfotransferase [Rhodospirillales bacterium]|nr:sulfotransferase [Rhodospirillales bacterium]